MDKAMTPHDPEARDSNGRLIALGVVVCAAAAAASFWLIRGAPPSIAPAASMIEGAPPTAAAVAPSPEALAPQMPPEDGDALLRKLGASWSTAPELARWLAAPSVLQRLAAATNMVAAGANPRAMLDFIELGGDFTVDEKIEKGAPNAAQGVDYRERDFISPSSYARYDRLTTVITSVDPGTVGRAYAQLRPYLDSAFSQIARPSERFDDVLEAAIDRLVAAPIPQGPVEVVPAGALYKYADPALEALRPAEKQLLRFGPTNQAAIKGWLQLFRAAALDGG